MTELNEEDREVVNTARDRGIAILPGLFDEGELAEIRQQFSRAYIDVGKGAGEPAKRDSISGEVLLAYPAVADLFIHPRILGIASAIMGTGGEKPWLWQLKTNRYTPGHSGVRKHTDGSLGELAPPFARQAMAVFLDDIWVESGALTYVPGSHKLHYEDEGESQRQCPTQEEIDAGEYTPAELKAGSVLFRVPEVWHAVNPIHHLRRYITASYTVRGRVSPLQEERSAKVEEQRQGKEEEVLEVFREYLY